MKDRSVSGGSLIRQKKILRTFSISHFDNVILNGNNCTFKTKLETTETRI